MEKANLLSHYIATLADFEIQEDVATGYRHMGALLVDAALQAGIRYETVVWPRVEAILATYPEALPPANFNVS